MEVIIINKIISLIIIFSVLISIFFIPLISINSSFTSDLQYGETIYHSENGMFIWPVPGYTRISSYFGKRTAPTGGASTYHKGIDIPAPEGTNLISVTNGTVTFTNFLGGGGYTITVTTENMKISYCHVSPNYIVQVGDNVNIGQIIGQIGPKYVYGVQGNKYTDSAGFPTNRCNYRTTSSSWHTH